MKNKQGGGERDLLERVMHNRFFRGTALFVRRYFDHRVARDSAALTYYLLFAMFPLLIFLSNLVGFFAVDIEGFLRQLGTIIPAEVLDLLIQYLRYVSRVSSRTLMTFSLIFSIWFPMRAANALLLSVRKAYGMGRPTQFLRHQAKVFLYTICLILTILLSLVLVTVGRSVLNLCADYFHFSAILTDGFIELWSTLRFVFLGCIVFLALAVLYGLAQETRSVHYVWPGVLFSLTAWMVLSLLFSLYVENAANYSVIYGSIGAIIVLLLCAAKRGGEVLVPNGHFVPQAGDRVYAIGTPTETARVLRSMGRDTSPIRQLSVIGGGRIALYLAWALDGMGMHITIVEQNEEKCMAIAEKLPKATILHGDGTDHDLLESEGIFDADAFVSLTGRDEENLLMALTAKDSGVAKVLPKMSRPNYTALVHDLGIDTVISPKDVTASQISSYVRGLANSQGSAVESLHKILGGAMEAVEFTATGATHFLNTPLKDLNFKPGLLVAAIVHGGKLLIPGGHSIISEGDRVIVVAKSLFLKDLNDILVR